MGQMFHIKLHSNAHCDSTNNKVSPKFIINLTTNNSHYPYQRTTTQQKAIFGPALHGTDQRARELCHCQHHANDRAEQQCFPDFHHCLVPKLDQISAQGLLFPKQVCPREDNMYHHRAGK